MRIICTAIVEEPLQRKNLVHCIEILGEKPTEHGNSVSLEYKGDDLNQVKRITLLFEQYTFHNIERITESNSKPNPC